MTEYTDKTIPIECGECVGSHIEEGVPNMVSHILAHHPQYNLHEADVYALKWAEDAYDQHDRETAAYHEDASYEHKLNKLRGKP